MRLPFSLREERKKHIVMHLHIHVFRRRRKHIGMCRRLRIHGNINNSINIKISINICMIICINTGVLKLIRSLPFISAGVMPHIPFESNKRRKRR